MTSNPTNPSLLTPVLFLIFNRPTLTKHVFEAIRRAKPAKLYIAGDGPRYNKNGEWEKCLQSRAIALDVDWECEVHTLFRDENLGCGLGVSGAINWFFEQEPEGIILEDDCLPSSEFFQFCSELLSRYRTDTRIMAIGGTNLVPEKFRTADNSYSFSNHNNIWGWATWRRAWNLYDYEMKKYKEVRGKEYFQTSFSSQYEIDYFNWVFEQTYRFPSTTWDFQWEFVRRLNSGLTIMPNKNLISNLGFGVDATHTTDVNGRSSELVLEELKFPLTHPPYVFADTKADRMAFIEHHTNVVSRLKSTIKSFLPNTIREKIFKISMERFIQSYNPKPQAKNYNSVREKDLQKYSSPNFR